MSTCDEIRTQRLTVTNRVLKRVSTGPVMTLVEGSRRCELMNVSLVRLTTQRYHHGGVIAGGDLLVEVGLAQSLSSLLIILVLDALINISSTLVKLWLHLHNLGILVDF